jgi:predicted nucleotidyltransferase
MGGIQVEFAAHITKVLKEDSNVIGLTVGGSWLNGEIDEFSDLDLILVTKEKISGSKENMLAYAKRFGRLLSAFTGEHVGDREYLYACMMNPYCTLILSSLR